MADAQNQEAESDKGKRGTRMPTAVMWILGITALAVALVTWWQLMKNAALLQGFAELLGAIAWPLVVLAIAMTQTEAIGDSFRKIAARIQGVKLWGQELNLSDDDSESEGDMGAAILTRGSMSEPEQDAFARGHCQIRLLLALVSRIRTGMRLDLYLKPYVGSYAKYRRAMKRLMDDGLVEKRQGRYLITPEGLELVLNRVTGARKLLPFRNAEE